MLIIQISFRKKKIDVLHTCNFLSNIMWPVFCFKFSFSAVLPSVGIGALSAREAEGRSNISAGEKVIILAK